MILMTNEPEVLPQSEYKMTVPTGDGNRRRVTIRTTRLHRTPNYLYQAYIHESEQPILEQISAPGVEELQDALVRHHSHQGRFTRGNSSWTPPAARK